MVHRSRNGILPIQVQLTELKRSDGICGDLRDGLQADKRRAEGGPSTGASG